MSQDKSDHQKLIIGPEKEPKWEDTHKISWKCGIIIAAVVIGSLVGIYFIVSDSSKDGSVLGAGTAGGHHYGRGNSLSRGGTSGGGGGCFDASTSTVWAKNESESDEYAREILIKDLEEGDLVSTSAIQSSGNMGKSRIWTRATDVDLLWGSWKGHNIIFSDGHNIKVTSPHLMIIWNDGISYFVRADQVQIGDIMTVENKFMSVTKIENYFIKSKVAVETEDGTINVDNVLASGICDNNPEVVRNVVKTHKMVKTYKEYHFGSMFDMSCMDTVAWKSRYFENNGYPVSS